VEAFTTLDLTEFRGRKLNVNFAKSSIATEDEYIQKTKNDRFNITVNHSRQPG